MSSMPIPPMRQASTFTLLILILPFAFSISVAGDVKFNRDVLPILSDNCYSCHGPDSEQRQADLRLDIREDAIAAGVINSNELVSSSLLLRITAEDPSELMPPPDSHKVLTAKQIGILQQWVAEGAEYEVHWAYVPPKRPKTPNLDITTTNPIDYFVQKKLDENGLSFAPIADKATLIRRLSLDLIGLPPSPDEIAAFVADNTPQATENLIDRLIARPEFGQQMAIDWLDVVRYADTVGFHGDQVMNSWPYRDYVIDSFNNNKPFDQFAIEQIAGDLLPDPTDEQLTATCFNRLNMMTREGGAQPEEYLAKYAADRVRTVGMAFLGSTFGCAECHDHKFDPISTRDFYAMSAYFADMKQWGVYADYNYTPNKDLPGWGNDHPFPPEKMVASKYLADEERRLTKDKQTLLATWRSEIASNEVQQASYKQWLVDAEDFGSKRKSGWHKLEVLPIQAEDPQTAATETEESAKGLLLDMPTLSAVKIQFTPISGQVISEPKKKLSLKPKFKLLRVDGSELPLAIYYGWANQFVPQYSGGTPIDGIHNNWVITSGDLAEEIVSVWTLTEPVAVRAGDKLVVDFESPMSSEATFFATPFAPVNAKQIELATQPFEESKSESLETFIRSFPDQIARRNALRELDAKIRNCNEGLAPVMIVETKEPVEVRILPRGNWQDKTGELVRPQTPGFLPKPADASPEQNRLDLAHWIVSEQNPLAARVVVNRMWAAFFGRGLSERLDDFGAQGSAPSHPELLDWLAVEFRESGWNIKHLVRLMVTSKAYLQSSNCEPKSQVQDPDNRLFSRHQPRRLRAELVRDNALKIAGLLNLTAGGPPSKPYQPDNFYAALQFPDRHYKPDSGNLQYRRGIFMHWQRTFLHPMLLNFGAPTREDCVAMRVDSNTPQQALSLLNDPSMVEAAKKFADNLKLAEGNDETLIKSGYLQAVGREPTKDESDSLLAMLATLRTHYEADSEAAAQLLKVGQAEIISNTSASELAAWTNVCRVLLNLHETITVY